MLSLDLSSGPAEEQVAQVGDDDYYIKGPKECRAWINQLKRLYGDHENLRLRIRSNPHDYGAYYTVEGKASCQESCQLLMKMEGGDSFWDDLAKAELGLVPARASR